MNDFVVKDSGERLKFDSGMVRDTSAGKTEFDRIFDGPMVERWAALLTKAISKYADIKPGVANWTLAAGDEERIRFRKSAVRHFIQWLRGDVDEDHAAAVFFNINGYEYVKAKLANAAADNLIDTMARALEKLYGKPGVPDSEIVLKEEPVHKAVDFKIEFMRTCSKCKVNYNPGLRFCCERCGDCCSCL